MGELTVLSGVCADLTARGLVLIDQDVADRFARWYGKRCISHPMWLRPISWTKTVRTEFGALMRVRFHEHLGRKIILGKRHEPAITQRILDNLGPGSLFVDVGANIGYYTLLAAGIVGNKGLVLAFEPSHRNLADLSLNLALNPSGNVVLLSTALSDDSGMARLSLPWEINSGVCSLGGGPSAHGDDGFRKGSHSVLRTAFDDFNLGICLEGWRGIVKIDAEGHEFQVVRGMTDLLSRNNLAVVCEVGENRFRDVVDFMSSIGYTGNYEFRGGWDPIGETAPAGLCNLWFEKSRQGSA